MRTLCLGEALVDLVCESPAASLAEAPAFVPHFGGATANVAVGAARAGAAVELAGGVGDDPWGAWLMARLRGAGVGLEWFAAVPGTQTPVAFVVSDAAGEPSFQLYAESLGATLAAAAERLPDAVDACGGLFFGSNTLAGRRERDLTMAARERALAAGTPVVFDPNVRAHRWRGPAEARAACAACLPGLALARMNLAEAELLTGEAEPERAASALLRAGARTAVVTLGAGGAILRGEAAADAAGVPANVRSTVGAGDALTGVLLARFAATGWDPAALADALPEAVAAGAAATERWSATG
jgi:sugar/nucleoside kinase (ribokinase family)